MKMSDFRIKDDENIDVWVNKKTGETRETMQAEFDMTGSKEKRQDPFVIAVMSYLVRMTDIIGNKKMQVVNYILDNMNLKGGSANALIITQKELAEKANVSRQTVSTTLNKLEEANLVKKRTGAIMLHPKIAMMGGKGKEKALMIEFKNFDKGSGS